MHVIIKLAKQLKMALVEIEYYFAPIWRLKKSGAAIGKNVFIGLHTYVELENAHLLTIEDDAVLSAHTKIVLHDSSLNNTLGEAIVFKRVVIKKRAYIGANSLLMPGSVVGEKTIVGANSLVTGVLAPNSVYVGQPAKRISSLHELAQKRAKQKKTSL